MAEIQNTFIAHHINVSVPSPNKTELGIARVLIIRILELAVKVLPALLFAIITFTSWILNPMDWSLFCTCTNKYY